MAEAADVKPANNPSEVERLRRENEDLRYWLGRIAEPVAGESVAASLKTELARRALVRSRPLR